MIKNLEPNCYYIVYSNTDKQDSNYFSEPKFEGLDFLIKIAHARQGVGDYPSK
jgi:hypothetical protein